MASAMESGSWAPAIAEFMRTPSAPNSIAHTWLLLALILGTEVTALLYWIDFATAERNHPTIGRFDWFAYLFAPGLLVASVIIPTGVHSGLNIVAIPRIWTCDSHMLSGVTANKAFQF